MGYLSNFIVYMLAMIGIMMIALFVFKQTTSGPKKSSGKCLKVLDTLSLGGRKTLYIVSAGEEKFLIAGDVDRTSLISKLSPKGSSNPEPVLSETAVREEESFREVLREPKIKAGYMDRSIAGIHSTQTKPYGSVIKNLAEKIQGGL